MVKQERVINFLTKNSSRKGACMKITANLEKELVLLLDSMVAGGVSLTRTQKLETVLYEYFFNKENMESSVKIIKEFKKKSTED